MRVRRARVQRGRWRQSTSSLGSRAAGLLSPSLLVAPGRRVWGGGRPGGGGNRSCQGGGGAVSAPHHCPLPPPGTPEPDSRPVLSRNRDRDPAPRGHHQPGSWRCPCWRGVGEVKLKTGAQSRCNNWNLSHDWTGSGGSGRVGPGRGGGSYCVPLCVPVTRAVTAQGPSVDLRAHGPWRGAVSGLGACPLPGVEQRVFRELEARAQRTGLPGPTCLSPAKLLFWCLLGPPSLWWRVGTPCLGGHPDMPCPEMPSAWTLRGAGC